MPTKRPKGPVFLRFVSPVVATLRELGSSGTASEVTDRVIERCRISESDQVETTSNGQSRVRNQIGWARFYLTKAASVRIEKSSGWRSRRSRPPPSRPRAADDREFADDSARLRRHPGLADRSLRGNVGEKRNGPGDCSPRPRLHRAPHEEPLANPFAGLSAGRVRSARTVPKMRTPANPGG